MLPLTLSSIALVGCGRKPEPTFPSWATPPAAYTPQPSSGNAFDGYIFAAQSAESSAGKYLTRVSFFPDQKTAAAAAIKDAFDKTLAATALPCRFSFTATPPFTEIPNHRGWRLIGRVLDWKAEDAYKAGDFDTGNRLVIAGSKFGFDLTGGGAMDASLGLSIVDDLRRTAVQYLAQMPPEKQLALSDGMRGALARQAPIETTIGNESQNIMLGVQAVQDDFTADHLDHLQDELGPTVKEAVDYLRELQDQKLADRAAYFEGFGNEAKATIQAFEDAGKLPVIKRPTEIKPVYAKTRPWKRFAPHFFGTLGPLLDLHDATTARTRLFILTASLRSQHERATLPPLSAFPAELRTDPYSGNDFVYRTDGPEFDLYSIGANRKDDGGDTDTAFSAPDLTLEEP